ncbi:MAG: HAD-IIIC family phosphatase, partial [Clostridia bacterium]|nr:HAD-IIIC family phosphatase [Clostridia bacterium]
GVRVKFRKWANMMTVLFPAMLSEADYVTLCKKNQKRGNRFKKTANSKLPVALKWQMIRIPEFLRRRSLRKLSRLENTPDFFVFHGWSHTAKTFRLVIEIYDDHTPTFKTAVEISQGENLFILDKERLSLECSIADRLVKIYPENDIEAELDILWCDFVQGIKLAQEQPAPTVKCVVWDLDNTLWDGILIETEDPKTLRLKEGILETIRELDARGIIQSVASKNDLEPAMQVLERLGVADYFLYPQIHWNPKSSSLEQIAKSLNIGIDALALVDDSEFERSQVLTALPMVRAYEQLDLSASEFDVPITEESKNRRAMYRAEEKRNVLAADQGDLLSFLKQCGLMITLFEPKSEADILRCYELTVRTNQLNLSGRKYSKEEFDELLRIAERKSFAFSCADSFGSYGIVGFGQYHVSGSQLIFDEFAMSCRVAGKYVESALFKSLLEQEGCAIGSFKVLKTKKNTLLRRTLEEIGFAIKCDEKESIRYSFGVGLKNAEIVKVIL